MKLFEWTPSAVEQTFHEADDFHKGTIRVPLALSKRRPVETPICFRDLKLLHYRVGKKYAVKYRSFGVVMAWEPVYSVRAPTSVEILRNRVLLTVTVIIELADSVPMGVHHTNMKGTAVAGIEQSVVWITTPNPVIIVYVPKAPFPLWEKHQTKCKTDLDMVTAKVKIALKEMRAGTRNLRGFIFLLSLALNWSCTSAILPNPNYYKLTGYKYYCKIYLNGSKQTKFTWQNDCTLYRLVQVNQSNTNS